MSNAVGLKATNTKDGGVPDFVRANNYSKLDESKAENSSDLKNVRVGNINIDISSSDPHNLTEVKMDKANRSMAQSEGDQPSNQDSSFVRVNVQISSINNVYNFYNVPLEK